MEVVNLMKNMPEVNSKSTNHAWIIVIVYHQVCVQINTMEVCGMVLLVICNFHLLIYLVAMSLKFLFGSLFVWYVSANMAIFYAMSQVLNLVLSAYHETYHVMFPLVFIIIILHVGQVSVYLTVSNVVILATSADLCAMSTVLNQYLHRHV